MLRTSLALLALCLATPSLAADGGVQVLRRQVSSPREQVQVDAGNALGDGTLTARRDGGEPVLGAADEALGSTAISAQQVRSDAGQTLGARAAELRGDAGQAQDSSALSAQQVRSDAGQALGGNGVDSLHGDAGQAEAFAGQHPTVEDAGVTDLATAEPDAGSAPLADAAADAGRRTFESIVSAERVVDVRRVAGSAHVITEAELQRHEHNDIHRVLDKVPGVYLRDEDGFGLRPNIGVRGATSDRSSKVTLMEDGVLFGPAPYSAPAAYYFPMVTRMSGVEVYKGPASVRFGPNTVGGAVNLLTRPIPQGRLAELDVSLGTYQSGKAHGFVGWGGERFGLLLEGVHLRSGGFKQLDGGGDTGFSKSEVLLKVRAGDAPGPESFQRLELKAGYSDERSNETYLGLADEDFELTPLRRYAASQNDQMNWRRTQLEASYFLQPVSGLELRAVAYRHDFRRKWDRLNGLSSGPGLYELLTRPATGQNAVLLAVLRGDEDSSGPDQQLLLAGNERTFVSQGVQATARWKTAFGPVESALEVGARFHHDEIERHHTEDRFDMLRGEMVSTGAATVDSARNNGFTRAFALHALEELSFGPLLLAPGARVEHIEVSLVDRLAGSAVENSSTEFLPGVGAVLQLGKSFSVLGGAHVGFSPVSPGQSQEVLPERSVNYELGGRFRRRGVKAELIGFLDDYFNITGECTFSSGCGDDALNQQFNGGKVLVYGLEAAVGVKQRGPWRTELGLDAAYTLTLSQFRTAFESQAPQFGRVEVGDELPYVPTHQLAVSARVSREPWSIALSASYVGAMREVAGQGDYVPHETTDARLVLDLAGHLTLSESAELYVTLNNLLDARYVAARRPFGARPGAPFMAQAGFKYQFR